MRSTRFILLVLGIAVTPAAWAQGLRDGDAAIGQTELAEELSGNDLEFYDGSVARYYSDARYEYRYRPQDPSFGGQWETNAESEVCVTFDNGFSRCDAIVRAGDRLVLITEDGLRFPIRNVEAIE